MFFTVFLSKILREKREEDPERIIENSLVKESVFFFLNSSSTNAAEQRGLLVKAEK